MEKLEILEGIRSEIYKDPDFIKDVIDTLIFGTREKIKDLSEDCMKKDKAMLVLFSKSNLGSQVNIIETAEQLTKSYFNGSQKVYTPEEVEDSFGKKRKQANPSPTLAVNGININTNQ